MEQFRLLLAIVLSFLVFIVWQWLMVEPELAKQQQEQAIQAESSTQTEDPSEQAAAPAEKTAVFKEDLVPTEELVPTDSGREGRTLQVKTPLYTVTLNEKGAAIDDLTLNHYRQTAEADGALKKMVHERARNLNLRTGFVEKSVAGMESAVYELVNYEDTIVVEGQEQTIDLQWVSKEGVRVQKEFVFSPDSYLIELKVSIFNRSTGAIKGQPAVKIAHVVDDPGAALSFEGPMGLLNDQLEEITIKDIEDTPQIDGSFRWIGITDRYFMTVLIPEEPVSGSMKMTTVGEDMVVSQLNLPETTIAPGENKTLAFKAFIGPKDTETLDIANYELGKAINFGFFDFLAKPFLWIMNQIYKVIPNYGIAIIILTLITKIILFPLGNKSYKSMNEMKRMQPLMTEIREKYKDDKKKMNEETMALYRTYKINPMGGCLPMLVQLPVFFALYRMLYQAIELRHAPFFGWITDLSAPDRLFQFGFSIPFMEPPYGIPVLTIVMGATMFLQQKMSPPPGDPTQAKLMMFMPLIFTVIFINFSAGLVLYWLINNVFSIAQQYYIQKKHA